ncbi:MAG: hypothetical protein IIT49_03655 [Clostridia bacterium]|nr:hypothetical protein [Clostridia bacterium]MBQ5439858.1 hypothetical protein [Clostridia bacterium]
MNLEYIIIIILLALLCGIALLVIRKRSSCRRCPYRKNCNKKCSENQRK